MDDEVSAMYAEIARAGYPKNYRGHTGFTPPGERRKTSQDLKYEQEKREAQAKYCQRHGCPHKNKVTHDDGEEDEEKSGYWS